MECCQTGDTQGQEQGGGVGWQLVLEFSSVLANLRQLEDDYCCLVVWRGERGA